MPRPRVCPARAPRCVPRLLLAGLNEGGVMFKRLLLLTVLLVSFKAAALATPVSVYGAWHCGNDACTWASVRDMTDFDVKNRWLVDRGDGTGLPSVNVVVLSFVQPLKLLNKTT